jgi:hypothetical protein
VSLWSPFYRSRWTFWYHCHNHWYRSTKDTNLLKELDLVSHPSLRVCSEHLFTSVKLHDTVPHYYVASSKKGFVKLLKKADQMNSSKFPTVPLLSLTPSVNLHRLNIFYLRLKEDGSPEIIVQLGWCLKSVKSVLQNSSSWEYWRWTCYLLKGQMDNQLSTSWISDESRCLPPAS